ncbi:hypothetical protein ACRN9A_17550 [Shewanella frigidimarina]|uniref:hypothetical protein n=1 Tax=Shewanella frigidimarina TaxID=56812 RepID=UPI003D79050E
MTSLISSLLSVGIVLSSMFVTIGVMFVLLKHRDRTVKLPVDREQLQRIPAFGLQQEIQDLQINLIASMLMGVLVVCLISTYFPQYGQLFYDIKVINSELKEFAGELKNS